MDVVLVADRTELACTEHPSDRGGISGSDSRPGVMIGLTEKARSPPVAREHECCIRVDRPQHLPQIGAGTVTVSHLKLHRRPDRHPSADAKRTLGRVGTDHPPHEKITAAERIGVFIDDETDVQSVRDQAPFLSLIHI